MSIMLTKIVIGLIISFAIFLIVRNLVNNNYKILQKFLYKQIQLIKF